MLSTGEMCIRDSYIAAFFEVRKAKHICHKAFLLIINAGNAEDILSVISCLLYTSETKIVNNVH